MPSMPPFTSLVMVEPAVPSLTCLYPTRGPLRGCPQQTLTRESVSFSPFPPQGPPYFFLAST